MRWRAAARRRRYTRAMPLGPIDALARCPLFATLPDEDLVALAAIAPPGSTW